MFVVSPEQQPYELKNAFDWGSFKIFIEIADDNYALRSVCEYENGYLTRYDRAHWDDQFGTLPDFKYGPKWERIWGAPEKIPKAEFEKKWANAKKSPPYKMRNESPEVPCLWIR